MIYSRYLNPIFFSILPFILFGLQSCQKFSGDQTIPAYLKIDSIYLVTQQSTQGTASHHITDVWVYVDDIFIGVFEMPAKFPVLKDGKHKVTLFPGIKKNGIAATRAAYPFFAPITLETSFRPDSTTSLGTLQATYLSSANFLWLEDFDNAGNTLDTTPRSSFAVEKTQSGSPLTFEGIHSGIITMDTISKKLECVTHSSYTIPNAAVYLELNFNINTNLTIGTVIYVSLSIVQTPVITLLPTNGQWKKIYIDLTTSLNSYTGATAFKVYLGNDINSSGYNGQILLDNFKLVTSK
jgi:hypothetical protein